MKLKLANSNMNSFLFEFTKNIILYHIQFDEIFNMSPPQCYKKQTY